MSQSNNIFNKYAFMDPISNNFNRPTTSILNKTKNSSNNIKNNAQINIINNRSNTAKKVKYIDPQKIPHGFNNYQDLQQNNNSFEIKYKNYLIEKKYIILNEDYKKGIKMIKEYDYYNSIYNQETKTIIPLNKIDLKLYSSSNDIKYLLENNIEFKLVNKKFLQSITNFNENDYNKNEVLIYKKKIKK